VSAGRELDAIGSGTKALGVTRQDMTVYAAPFRAASSAAKMCAA
jgi:hypothetical protein